MEQTFKQRIAGKLLQLENIIIGFSEGSIQDVYSDILDIAIEMDLQKEVVGDLVSEMDGKFESTYIDDCYRKIKELQDELERSKQICFKLIQEVNSLRKGLLSDNLEHYEDVERLIQEKYTNVDLRI